MTKKDDKKAKGTELTNLDIELESLDGEVIWYGKETLAGIPICDRDEKTGVPTSKQHQAILTRRVAITAALALEPEAESYDADAKLRAGHLQAAFWNSPKVKLDAEDITFLKDRLNNRWNGMVLTYMDTYLEGGMKADDPAPEPDHGPDNKG